MIAADVYVDHHQGLDADLLAWAKDVDHHQGSDVDHHQGLDADLLAWAKDVDPLVQK
jgi:hypothetical protein